MSFGLDGRKVGPGEPALVIAEIGSNHNGDKQLALELVDAAADAGADAVKFQLFEADSMYPEDSGGISTGDESAYSLLKSLEVPPDWVPELATYASERGLRFLASPFDEDSADRLAEYVPAYKVASTLLSHHPFVEYLAQKSKPLILSTGAHAMDDVAAAMTVLGDLDVDVVLLQCVSAYPTPLERANVSVLRTLRARFGVPTGLSDHTEDPVVAPTVAASFGASVIEKHLTLDRTLEGPDHSFALEPDEFERMVSHVRAAEAAIGDGQKAVLDIERETYENGRRCLHAARHLRKGHSLTEADIAWLRPGSNPRGIPPSEEATVLGRRLARDVERGETIAYDDLAR